MHTSSSIDTDPTQDMQEQSDSGKQFPGLSGASKTAMESRHAEVTDPTVWSVDATDSDTNRNTAINGSGAYARCDN